MTALLPQFGGLFMTLLAFIAALSVIVAVHEYGHYIVGRWSGIKAEVFSVGFGPVLFARTDKHGTVWQVAALPFGGYVKFLGDASAASAKDETAMAAAEADPARLRQTMHGAPLWARTATVAAGPVFNFIMSILIFGAIMMTQGRVAEPLSIGELRPLPAQGAMLEAGDVLIAIDGQTVPGFDDDDAFNVFTGALRPAELLDYTVRRNGAQITLPGPHPLPPVITQLAPQSAAFEAGLKVGDVITAIDGDTITAFSELQGVVEGSNGRSLALTVWRGGQELPFTLAPKRVDEPQPEGGFKTQWRIGIAGGLAFEPGTERLGPVAALQGGVEQTYGVIENSISGLYHMISGAISTCNMSGPIGIAQVSGAMASQGFVSFIWFIAVLSTAVGLLNLFPIPVLDGGHLVFYAYEAITGRPPSDKALRVLMAAGLTLILSLMGFAIFNDIFCP